MTNSVGNNQPPSQLPIPQDVHPAMTRFHQYLVDRHLESRRVFDRFDPAHVVEGTYVKVDEPIENKKEKSLTGNPIDDFFTMLDSIFTKIIEKLKVIQGSLKVIKGEVDKVFA